MVAVVVEGGIEGADGDDLVVESLLVAHPHDADGTCLDDRERVDRFLAQDQGVQRVAIVTERPGDEAVVGRVVHGAVQHPVQPHQSRFLVELVLVLAAHRHFDDDGEGLGDQVVVDVDVVPGVHTGTIVPGRPSSIGLRPSPNGHPRRLAALETPRRPIADGRWPAGEPLSERARSVVLLSG